MAQASRPDDQLRHARSVARWNGRMVLYLLTPLILAGPLLAPDGPRWWHFLIAAPLAVAGVIVSRAVVRWGDAPVAGPGRTGG